MDPICLGYIPDQSKPCYHYLKPGLCLHPRFFRCIEYMRKFEPALSYSAIQTFLCPRKFYFRYIVGWESITKPLPMRLGGLASELLDLLHSDSLNYGEVDVVELAVNNKLVEKYGGQQDEEGYYQPQFEALLSVFQAYAKNHFHETKGSVQKSFTWKEEGFPSIRGILDMLQYEEYIGWEFKYTQKGDAYTKFTLQDQLSSYFLSHPKVERFTVRTIHNPINTIKLGKKEDLKAYRERVFEDAMSRPRFYVTNQSYWRSEFDLDSFKIKARMIANDILSYIEAGAGDINAFYQRNSPYTCFLQSEYGPPSPCEYLSICESGVISEGQYKRVSGKVLSQDVDTGKVSIG